MTAAVHYAKTNDDRRTICGWRFVSARRQRGSGPAYRVMHNLREVPGMLMCESCLPTERATALNLLEVEAGLISGDD